MWTVGLLICCGLPVSEVLGLKADVTMLGLVIIAVPPFPPNYVLILSVLALVMVFCSLVLACKERNKVGFFSPLSQ